MPNEIVEGYTASQQAKDGSAQGASALPVVMTDAWIDGLRRELRRDMIRELALRRIRSSSGRENQPREHTRAGRMIEAFFVGVAVTLVSSWICSRAMKSEVRR